MTAVENQKPSKFTLGKVKGSFDLVPAIIIAVTIVIALLVGLLVGIVDGSTVPVIFFGVLGAAILTVSYSRSVIEQ